MRIYFTALSLLLWLCTNAQSDSLWAVWNNKSLPDSARLKAMEALSWKAVFERPDSGIVLANLLLGLAERSGSRLSTYKAYGTLAAGSKMKGDLSTALDHYERCMAIANALNDRGRRANTLSNMSTVYKEIGDLPKALDLLQQSLRIDQDLGNSEGMAGTYNNIGNIYKRLNEFPKALENYERSAKLFAELGNRKGQAGALVSIGTTHSDLGDREMAITELQEAITLYEQLGSRLDLGKAHNNLGQVLGRMKRFTEAHAQFLAARKLFTELGAMDPLARNWFYTGQVLLGEGRARAAVEACSTGLHLADSLGFLAQRKECAECLLNAYAASGDFRKAFEAQALYLQMDDSLDEAANSKEVTRVELTHAFREEQIADSLVAERQRFEQALAYQEQLTSERTRRYLLIGSAVGLMIFAGALYSRLRIVRRSREEVQRERDRSDGLLLNILPEEVANELKAHGKAEARSFANTTVLFTDFKGFTAMSESLSAAELVSEIDHCFKGLDAIVERYGVEKIKTIGDAYMAVAGLPDPQAASAADIVRAALDMCDFIHARAQERLASGKPAFEMRVGLHSGPVIAGIVGVKKFAYDIWGDTVNTAARMESSGEPGKVNISATTFALVRNEPDLRFEPRGRVEAKGKGELEMVFVYRAQVA